MIIGDTVENIIRVTIDTMEDITSRFNDELLDEEFTQYLLKHTFIREKKITNKIVIESNLDFTKEKEIESIIKEHFNRKIKMFKIKDLINDKLELFMLLLGIILLIAYYLTNQLNIIIISEILLISGWVLIWEWFYKKVFDETSEKIELKKCNILLKTEIIFKKK